jgi:HD-like signal output (HDOD) protein
MLTVRESIEKKLRNIAQLPTMPEVLFKIEEALHDENAAAGRLAGLIREDPALTASVLRVANSVTYRGKLNTRISSVKNAVARLGFTEIQRICLSTVLIRTFKMFGQGINHAEFWKHSLTVGLATQIFNRYSNRADPLTCDELDDAFVAGLLHDLGLLVMDQYFPEQLAAAQKVATSEEIALALAEMDTLGIHHGEVGGILLGDWQLPAAVVSAVAWHHDPDKSEPEFRRVVQMVHLADFICVNQSIGQTIEGLYDGFSAGAWHDLGLSIDQAPSILEDLKEELSRSEVLSGA